MKKAAVELDSFDLKLLTALQRRGRASFVELGEAVSLSESACLRRVRALEEQGVISRYAAVIDERAVGLPLSVFVTVTLSSQAESALSAFEKAVASVREVVRAAGYAGFDLAICCGALPISICVRRTTASDFQTAAALTASAPAPA